MGDDALFCCGISREIPPSFLSLKSVLDTLVSTQEVPQHTCLHSLGNPSVLPQLKKTPFYPLYLEQRVHFPASLGKASGVPFALQEEGISN